jgi:hypothetical protein
VKSFLPRHLRGIFLIAAVLVPCSAPSLRAAIALEDVSIAEMTALLTLSEEQAEAVQTTFATFQAQHESLQAKIPAADSAKSRRALVDEGERLAHELRSALEATLSPEQSATLKAHLAATPPIPRAEADQRPGQDLRRELQLSPDQAIQMAALMQVYQPHIQVLMEELKEPDGFFQKRKIAKPLKSLRDEMNAAVRSILDPDQYAQWSRRMEANRESFREQLNRD